MRIISVIVATVALAACGSSGSSGKPSTTEDPRNTVYAEYACNDGRTVRETQVNGQPTHSFDGGKTWVDGKGDTGSHNGKWDCVDK